MDLSALKPELPEAGKKNDKGCGTDIEVSGHIYTKEEKDNFLLTNWYSQFKSVTIPTICLSMPKDYALMLGTGGICDDSDDNSDSNTESGGDDEEDWTTTEATSNDSDDPVIWAEFYSSMDDAIKKLGGAVVPKVLWKVPIDCKHIILNGPRCNNVGDVNNLVKFSMRAYEDVRNPYRGLNLSCDLQPPYHLYLRKWMDFQESDVFRCFVYGGKFVAIAQRDLAVGYRSILDQKNEIIQGLYNFFVTNIFEQFGNGLQCYSFDVIRFNMYNLKILDFNVCDNDTLLPYFTWEEFIQLWECQLEETGVGRTDEDSGETCDNSSQTDLDGSRSSKTNKTLYRASKNETHLPESEIYGNPYFRFSTRNLFNF